MAMLRSGDRIKYSGAHKRVTVRRGKPTKCAFCGRGDGRIEWASMNKRYHDLADYKALCVSCHRAMDAKRKNTCLRGHEFTEENTGFAKNRKRIKRVCRACDVIRQTAYRERRAA